MPQYIVEWEYQGRPVTRRSVVLEADNAEQAMSALRTFSKSVRRAQGKIGASIVFRQIYLAGVGAEVARQVVQEKLT